MKVTKQTFSTFTKEGVSRKYYTSFCIHIQPSYKIKLMQILFEPSDKPSYEYLGQHFLFQDIMEKPRTLLKTVPVTELRSHISLIQGNGMIHYSQIT